MWMISGVTRIDETPMLGGAHRLRDALQLPFERKIPEFWLNGGYI